jgi:hypothetical protein
MFDVESENVRSVFLSSTCEATSIPSDAMKLVIKVADNRRRSRR